MNDNIDIIDTFVGQLDYANSRFKHLSQFLNYNCNRVEGLNIIDKHLKKMKSCYSLDELKKYLKVNKVIDEMSK